VSSGHERWAPYAWVLLWVTPLLWTVNFVVARQAVGVIDPHTLAAGRWGLGALIMLTLTWPELWRERRSIWLAWPQHLTLGFLGMVVCGAWVYIGAHTAPAMNIALIYSAAPVVIALIAVGWLHEPIRLRQIAGIVLALAGVLHVVLKGQWLQLGSVQWVAGDLWLVACTVAWAAYAVLHKVWPSPLSPAARLAVVAAGGTLLLLPIVAWELQRPSSPQLGTHAVGLIVAAAIFPGVAAFWAYAQAQKILGATRVAATLYLGPLYAAIVAWGYLGEPLGWHHALGAALILPGLALVSQATQKRPQANNA
jgi:drug/metabolite transporter (DMT)-like permease